MKKTLLIALCMAGIMTACNNQNPFFTEWTTPYGVPPFDQIKNAHFLPAYEEALAQLQADIDRIAANADAPTFENTIVALDNAGALLAKVNGVFMNVVESDSDPERQAIEETISPKLTKSTDDIYLNAALFARVKVVYEQKAQGN
ncbi:MAG: peptidase M3, partial [Prevotellaceae bacterium]|nr:peptidase M3 [Prevotellaceae bacterium]